MDNRLGGELQGYGEDDYLLFDCPGQIELYSHSSVFRSLIKYLQNGGWTVCTRSVCIGRSQLLAAPDIPNPPVHDHACDLCIKRVLDIACNSITCCSCVCMTHDSSTRLTFR